MALIVPCTPTRGLLYRESIQSISRNLDPISTGIAFSKNKGIPDCHIEVVEKALLFCPSHIWIVEEDIVAPPKGVAQLFTALVTEDAYVAVGKYKLADGNWSFQQNEKGELLWSGLGCALIKTSVFKFLPKSKWFRNDFKVTISDDLVVDLEHDPENRRKHHRLDKFFFAQLHLNQIKSILVDDVICKHLYVEELNKEKINGCHVIKERT